MRTYPIDSPRAAARVIVLSLLADGASCQHEQLALKRAASDPRLGVDEDLLQRVKQELCEDIAATHDPTWLGSACLDEPTLGALLDEVHDPRLRLAVYDACVDIVRADGVIGAPESYVLSTAKQRWAGFAIRDHALDDDRSSRLNRPHAASSAAAERAIHAA